mgnify:CR=1 FL=1
MHRRQHDQCVLHVVIQFVAIVMVFSLVQVSEFAMHLDQVCVSGIKKMLCEITNMMYCNITLTLLIT